MLVLAIFAVCSGRLKTDLSVSTFDTLFGQCQTVVPPGCSYLPRYPQWDGLVNSLVDVVCDVGYCLESIILSLELREIHLCRLDSGVELLPVGLMPAPAGNCQCFTCWK